MPEAPMNHLAIIMDGNGRYAKSLGHPRLWGHRKGAEAFERTIRLCAKYGVRVLTVYAFSTENWKRPEEEVSGLFSLMVEYCTKKLPTMVEAGIRIKFLGERTRLPQKVQDAVKLCEESTAAGDKVLVQIALNYGGRDDIVRAARAAMQDGIAPEELTEEKLSSYLDTAGVPDPDLILRTGGEARLSNFLLWQAAYSEMLVMPVYWPEFDEPHFLEAMEYFQKRDRRFGGLTK